MFNFHFEFNMIIQKQILFLVLFIATVFTTSAEPYKVIYEKSSFSNQSNYGYSNPIFCVNDDGSIITVSSAITSLALARIHRNGEIYWNRRILSKDEFNPNDPNKIMDVQNVIYDGYSNHFTGYYRNNSIFKGSAFLYFHSPNGDIQQFSYDTTFKSLQTGYNIVSRNTLSEGLIFFTNRFELFTNDSVNFFLKHYMTKYNECASLRKSIIFDTVSYKVPNYGYNLYMNYNKILNLNFCNNSALGDSILKLEINYFDCDLNYKKKISIPFSEFPKNFDFTSTAFIPSEDTTKLVFYATSAIKDLIMMLIEINLKNQIVKYKEFNYYKPFTLAKAICDKDGNIIVAGMCNRVKLPRNGPQQFAIFQFDPSFNLIDSLIWERGENSIMMGFDKYGDDEFIVTGYYLDKDKYAYRYTARLNSNPSGTEEVKEEGISIKQYDEQLYIESHYSGLDLQIYDVLGKVYLTQRTDQQSAFVELENIPSGFYIVSVSSGTSRRVYKIIK